MVPGPQSGPGESTGDLTWPQGLALKTQFGPWDSTWTQGHDVAPRIDLGTHPGPEESTWSWGLNKVLHCWCCSDGIVMILIFFQRMEASFQAATMMEVHVEGVELAHKTPPRVPPKPTSKSPTPASLVAKVAGGRHQSPSPVRHVKAPTPTPVRWVEPLCM